MIRWTTNVIKAYLGRILDDRNVYDSHPRELGYKLVDDKLIIRTYSKLSLLSFLLCMLIVIIRVYEPFGFTFPFQSSTEFAIYLSCFLLFIILASKVKSKRRICPICTSQMDSYANVERSTFKYTCHECRVFIDTGIANYSDP